jgi:outer membrane protein OmpA-like peptidoglycan-associated protein
VIALLGYQWWQRIQWDRCFADLRHQPGIVITGIERNGSSYTVGGLEDPGARGTPEQMVRAHGLDPRKVTFRLEPYYSLNTEFARRRQLDAARQIIETRLIRFDTNTAKLPPGEADHIDDVAAAMKNLQGVTFTVTGRADDTGNPDNNSRLSQDRAKVVSDALRALGIAPSAIKTLGVGNTQPLRQGNSEWERQANRSVSFSVSAIR